MRAVRAGGPLLPWAAQELVQSHLRLRDAAGAEAALRALLPQGSAILLHALGYLHRRTGRVDLAAEELEAASSASPPVHAALSELGWILCTRGRADEGLALLRRAEAHFMARRDAWGAAIAVTYQATHAFVLWRQEDAVALFRKARALKVRAGDAQGVATADYHLGGIWQRLDRLGDAARSFESALQTWTRLSSHAYVSAALNALASVASDLGDPERAQELQRRSVRALRRDAWRRGTRDEARLLSVLGYYALRAGRRRAAWTRSTEAAAMARAAGDADVVALAVVNAAEAALALGRAADALALVEEFRAGEPAGVSPLHALDLAGVEARSLLRTGDAAAAERVIRGALRSEHDARMPGDMLLRSQELHATWGQALVALGRLGEARTVLEDAAGRLRAELAEVDSGTLRLAFAEGCRRVDDARLDVAMAARPPDVRAALEIARASKARGLRDGGCPPGDPARGDPAAEIESGIRDLTSREALTASERRRLRELRARHSEIAAWTPASDARAGVSGAVALDEDTALLEFHVSDDATRIFVRRGDALDVVTSPRGATDVEARVRRLVAPLHAAARVRHARSALARFDWDLAARCHADWISPVERLAGDARRLVIVPDGALHELPFDALVRRRSSAATEFLADRYDVALAPASVAAGDAPCRTSGVLVFAHALRRPATLQRANGVQRLEPLAHAALEARSVARSHARATIVEDADATVARFEEEAPRARIVHVSAHAVADLRAPGLSGLVLSGTEGRPLDFLTAERIASLRLDADLVVLSGCETASGRVRAREGVMSLARAFLLAGARCVVASRWAVDDEATASLMADLHARLERSASPHDALAAAKSEARRSARDARSVQAHPFYWAAFTATSLPSSRSPTSCSA